MSELLVLSAAASAIKLTINLKKICPLPRNNGGCSHLMDYGFKTIDEATGTIWYFVADGNGEIILGTHYSKIVVEYAISNFTEDWSKLFTDCNKKLYEFTKQMEKEGLPYDSTGTTLTIVGIRPNREIICANVGDSTCFIISKKPENLPTYECMIGNHTLSNMDEVCRVMRAGGSPMYETLGGSTIPILTKVKGKWFKTKNELLGSVPFTDVYGTLATRIYVDDEPTVKDTRMLGYFELLEKGIVSCTPSVHIYTPDPDEALCVVVGSDGMSDSTHIGHIIQTIMRGDLIGKDEIASEALLQAVLFQGHTLIGGGFQGGFPKFGSKMDNSIVGVHYVSGPSFSKVTVTSGFKRKRVEVADEPE